MKTVFVVLGEYGEYEQAGTIVCGVYETRERAEAARNEHSTRRSAHEAWRARFGANWPKLPLGYFKFPLAGDQAEEYAAMEAKARAAAGSEPPFELADETFILEIPTETWGVWRS